MTFNSEPEIIEQEASLGQALVSLPQQTPLWSRVLLGTIVVIWIGMELYGNLVLGVRNATQNTVFLVLAGAKFNPLITSGEWWRLLTSTFIHIGFMHLLFNAFALFQLGPEAERLFGRGRFLVIYFLAGLYGSLASYIFSSSVSAGASGAIFGLVGALIAYMLRYRRLFGGFGQSYLTNMLVIVAINFVYGLTTGVVDNWGHGGGLIAGLLFGWLLSPRYAPPAPVLGPQTLRDKSSPVLNAIFAVVGLIAVFVVTAAVANLRS